VRLFIILWCLTVSSFASGIIGDIILQTGNADIERTDGEKVEAKEDLDIFSYDTVKTGKGKVAIGFIDETRVDVTEHSKLIIDEFVYDPNTKTGSLSLKAALGTIRYASGQIAKTSPTSVQIKTPTATIGVRGTDFTMTIDEIGSSTIILLPSCDSNGFCFVGEITVDSDAGQVIMNQAFQATVVDTISSKPLKPVILSLEENFITNLLIISQPREIAEAEQEEEFKKTATALDVDLLAFDELDKTMEDYLEELDEEDKLNQLDRDFLSQNFLGDILEQLNLQLALAMANTGLEVKKSKGDIVLGKDEVTGITILDEDPQWYWHREGASGSVIELRLEQANSYIMNIQVGDFELIDFELGGTESEINIIQSQ
jgi:hypothetical protein|tara:strand:+ start:481 stop:1596 length:1116 start_codon:yes stop_codon:yes gene_type:complete